MGLVRLEGPKGRGFLARLEEVPPMGLRQSAALTPAEQGVAASAAAGLSVTEISHDRRVSPNTVKTLLRRIYDKLEVATRVELARAMADR